MVSDCYLNLMERTTKLKFKYQSTRLIQTLLIQKSLKKNVGDIFF